MYRFKENKKLSVTLTIAACTGQNIEQARLFYSLINLDTNFNGRKNKRNN